MAQDTAPSSGLIGTDRPLAELTPILDSAFGQWVPPASAKAVKTIIGKWMRCSTLPP